MKKKVTMIDPPSGWRYGFPKPLPDGIDDATDEQFCLWLTVEGYPRWLHDQALKHSRYWYGEIDVEEETVNEVEEEKLLTLEIDEDAFDKLFVQKMKQDYKFLVRETQALAVRQTRAERSGETFPEYLRQDMLNNAEFIGGMEILLKYYMVEREACEFIAECWDVNKFNEELLTSK